MPIQIEWRPQTELLREFENRTATSHIFKHEAFSEAVNWLTDHLDLDRFPPGQIKGMQSTGRQKLLSFQNVATPDLMKAVHDLYRPDFERFGYEQTLTLQ